MLTCCCCCCCVVSVWLVQLRELWLPLVCRSLAPLRRVAEEVAQRLYRQTQDLMQAGIFFLAAGKRATLRQLAKTVRDDRKALDKLMQQDLRSARGREVVAKNAFHLLRLRQYSAAATVFLLPDPPGASLLQALDVMVRHLRDPCLALLVARLLDGEQDEEGVLGPAATHVLELDVLPFLQEQQQQQAISGGGGGWSELEAMALLWLGRAQEAVQAVSIPPPHHSTHQPQSGGVEVVASALQVVEASVCQVLPAMAVAQQLDPSMVLGWRALANLAHAQANTNGRHHHHHHRR